MDASAVIEMLGGPAAVARRFGASRTAVYNWRRHGIPAKYWFPFHEAAQADRKDIPLDAIRWRPAEPPRRRPRAAAPQRAGAD